MNVGCTFSEFTDETKISGSFDSEEVSHRIQNSTDALVKGQIKGRWNLILNGLRKIVFTQ